MKSIRTNHTAGAPQGDERIRTAVTAPGADPAYERHAAEFAATLTDEQLVAVTDAIRGSSKRGRRRRMLPAEVLALAAIYAEQRRRGEEARRVRA